MASLGNPRAWVPYMNSKDCSQGFCSLYCPQWCYIVYPPPPPNEFPEEDSRTNFSPLVITIIGILASAFLLVSYYTVISKYCANRESARRDNHDPDEALDDNHNPSLHEPWHSSTTGLDEALIKSITVCKYKKGDGLLGVTDCSVCISEFQEDESVRLLPKCSHAFHLSCIDTWLKSHSNCPLCRASIFTFNPCPSAPQVAVPILEISPRSEASTENQHSNERVASGRDNERDSVEEEVMHVREAPKQALRAFSDLSSLQGRHSIIEIRDEGYDSIRRSISMDHSFQSGLSVSDVLLMNQDQDTLAEECSAGAGPSKRSHGESSKSSYKRRVLHCVMSPVAMKRSFSSGRFSFTRNARGRQGIIPV